MARFIRRFISGLTVLIALFFLFPWGYIGANGSGKQIFHGSSGRLAILVRIQPEIPRVGIVHITVEAVNFRSSDLLPNTEVEIVAFNPAGEATYRVRALNKPDEPHFYDANISFDVAGDWVLLVGVSSQGLGVERFSVPLGVKGQALPPTAWGTLVWATVLAALVFGVAYLSYKSRLARANR